MRTRILITLAATASMLFLAGCETWLPGGTVATSTDGSVSMQVPQGWMFTRTLAGANADLLATKDGVLLQALTIEHQELKDPLPNSKRKLTADLSPFEIAEAVIDDMRANREMLNIAVKENTPATVGGSAGFRILVSYDVPQPSGLGISQMRYGTIVGNRLYLVTFLAPSRHYFERDLSEVDAAVSSLVITPSKAPAK